jgi:alpha-1,2-mannosyltransferase
MRVCIAISLALGAGIFVFAVAAGLSGSLPVAFLAGAVAAGISGLAVWTRPIVAIDKGACSPPLNVVSGLATVVALVQLARLTVFMVAPAQVAYSTVPSSAWEVRHSCLTAYFVAGEAVGQGHDIYDDALYTAPEDTGAGQRKARMLGPFGIDVYEYPPPFLLVPRACRLLTTDFMRMRTFWFGLSGGIVLLAMLVVARGLGPAIGTRALLLLPLFWAAPATMNTLQKGNIQPVVIALAMLAMLLFERRRWAAGGALLAYAIVAKLYPGMLGVYLLARRQWRAAAWTAAMGLVMVVLTLVDVGLPPFAAFMHHLPGLLSGEAFPAFRNPGAKAINISVPGLVFKAGLFGVPGMGFGASKIVGWLFTIVIVWATVRAARRAPNDHEKPLVWMAILILATLRSPFLPQTYGVLPALWILTLLAATYAPTTKTLSLVLLASLALNVHWPLDWAMDPRLRAILNGLPQTATIALVVLGLRRRVEPEPSTLDV